MNVKATRETGVKCKKVDTVSDLFKKTEIHKFTVNGRGKGYKPIDRQAGTDEASGSCGWLKKKERRKKRLRQPAST